MKAMASGLAVSVLLLGLLPASSWKWAIAQALTLALLALGLRMALRVRPASWPAQIGERLRELFRSALERLDRTHDRTFLLGAAAAQLLLAGTFASVVFGRVPHVSDEVAQLFHARILLDLGAVTAPSPPLADDFFQMSMTVMEPRWYSQYPPLHILMLAAGRLLGAAWLVNPLISSLTLIVLFLFTRDVLGRSAARLTALLFLACPGILVMSSSFMNHSTALLGTSLFFFALSRTLRSTNPLYALTAGLAIGGVFLTRPYTAVAMATPAILVAAGLSFRQSRLRPRLALVATGGLLGVSGLLYWNVLTNDSALTLGYVMRAGSLHSLGFGPRMTGFFTPWDGLQSVLVTLQRINYAILGWPIPLLLFVGFGCTRWADTATQRPDHRASWETTSFWVRLLTASAVALWLAYGGYFSNLWIYGPRSFYSGLATLLPLASLGMIYMYQRIEALSQGARSASYLLIVPAVVASLAVAFVDLARDAPDLSKSRRVEGPIGRIASDAGLENALVFVPHRRWENFSWRNHPNLTGPIVYARHRGNLNRQLMERFPERDPFLVCSDRVVPLPTDLKDLPSGCPRDEVIGRPRRRGFRGEPES